MALAVVAALGGCSSSSESTSESVTGESPHANVDLGNTRNAPSSIEADNVSDLELAWSHPIKGEGVGDGFTGSPVVADGVVYIQDQGSNVSAIDLRSGRTRWKTQSKVPTHGPTALSVAEDLVIATTPVYALGLEIKTGKAVWTAKLIRNWSETVATAPGYHRGLVYASTTPYDEKGGEVGTLWALSARTGRKVWHFDTVPRNLWGNPEINFGGGVLESPAFDEEGSMYVGTANPGPIPGLERYPWGSSRPGPNLYSNSIVKLNEKTGKVEWHYQLTPHGLCNWDVGAPLLTESDGREVVVVGSLGGIVVALDRETGELLWRRSVGTHNGHDDDGLLAMRGEDEKLKTPMTVSPGVFGGVAGSMSVQGSTVFVPVVNSATRLNTQESAELVGPSTGELVALDLATGAVKWKESFRTPLYGPTLTTNDLVFAISFEGEIHAFDSDSGEEVWSERLPSEAEGGLTATGDTLLVRAGFPAGESVPKLLAFRISD